MTLSTSTRSPREQQLDALIAKYYEAIEQRQPLNRAAFLRQHPEFAVELQEYWEDAGRLQAALGQQSASMSATIGTVLLKIRDYQLLSQIGAGGMGTVYLALHQRLQKTVALKILKADRKRDSSSIARFEREMKSVGKLEHPHIVRALDAGDEGGTYFLVMEFLEGCDLGQLLKTKGRLEVPLACELIHQAALGLQHAHDQNLVHRDVKPSNLMLSTTGQVKVLDLGLAQLQMNTAEQDEMTHAGEIVGTWRYMAPEQVLAGRQVDARSDIFSLGVTLYNLLVGELPLRFGQSATHLPPIVKLRSDVPPDLQLLLGKMLAPNPPDRIQKMSEVAGALQAYQRQGAFYIDAIKAFLNLPLPQSSTAYNATQSRASVAYETEVSAPQFQAPPPRQVVRAATLPAASAPIPSRGSWRHLTPVSATLAVTAVSAAAMILAMVMFWNPSMVATPAPGNAGIDKQGEQPPPPPPPPPPQLSPLPNEGIVTLALDKTNPNLAAIPMSAFAIRKDDNQEPIPLKPGENTLSRGSYFFYSEHQDCLIEPAELSVGPGPAQKIVAKQLPHVAWLYPRLPDQEGDYIEATGSLWMQKELPDKTFKQFNLPYDLQLRMGAKKDAGQWIELEVTTRGYTESGMLLIDIDEYNRSNKLKVIRGSVTGGNRSIADRLTEMFPKDSPQKLAVKFDEFDDALAAKAEELAIQLPKERIRVQDALNLLFGTSFESGSPLMWDVRKLLAEDSKRIGSRAIVTNGPKGDHNCWVYKSNVAFIPTLGVPGYSLYRDEGVPFSLVQIDVITKNFKADFKLTGCGKGSKTFKGLQNIEADVAAIDKFKRPMDQFDQASIPDNLGAAAIYHVAVHRGSLPEKVFNVSLRMADAKDPNVLTRLLEVVVTDGFEFTEEAQLQVLDQRETWGRFVVHKGWIRQQGEIFPFDPTGNRESFEAGLLKLGKNPKASELTIHDVLALLFGARFEDKNSGMISKLRQSSAIELAKDEKVLRVCSYEDEEGRDPIVLFDNRRLPGEVWSVDKSGGTTSLSYKFYRSRQLPFNFNKVRFSMTKDGKNVFELTAILKGYKDTGAPSPLGIDITGVVIQQDSTARRVKEAESDVNWRVWKWSSMDKEQRAWAEYRGKLDNDSVLLDDDTVLLKNKQGSELRLPLKDFNPEDQIWINGGRKWHQSEKAKTVFPLRGNFVKKSDSSVRMMWEDGTYTFESIYDFSMSDQTLLNYLAQQKLKKK